MDDDRIMVIVEQLFNSKKNDISFDKEKFREYARILVERDDDILLTDVYLVLFFTYYSLVVNEQTEDWLFTRFLWRHARYKRKSICLYYEITAGDIMVDGVNISSMIRRDMFGFVSVP
jgi:hypothetical protein